MADDHRLHEDIHITCADLGTLAAQPLTTEQIESMQERAQQHTLLAQARIELAYQEDLDAHVTRLETALDAIATPEPEVGLTREEVAAEAARLYAQRIAQRRGLGENEPSSGT